MSDLSNVPEDELKAVRATLESQMTDDDDIEFATTYDRQDYFLWRQHIRSFLSRLDATPATTRRIRRRSYES